MQRTSKTTNSPSKVWKYLSMFMICTILPWAMYLQFREKADQYDIVKALKYQQALLMHEQPPSPQLLSDVTPENMDITEKVKIMKEKQEQPPNKQKIPEMTKLVPVPSPPSPPGGGKKSKFLKSTLPPVVGNFVTNGSKPLWGLQHKGTDAIMALACKYPVQFYKRFVGTLRKFGYEEDIVFAVSTEATMKPGVGKYLKSKNVLSYGFDVEVLDRIIVVLLKHF